MIISPKGSIARPFTLEDHQLRMRQELSKRYDEHFVNQFAKRISEFQEVSDISKVIASSWLK